METAPALPEIKKFITVKIACDIVGISEDTFWKLIRRNKGPRTYRFGRILRIHPDDFQRWLEDPNKTMPRTGPAASKRKK